MRKYLQIFKISYKENKVAFVNTVLSMVSFVIIMIVFYNLWRYMYTNVNSTIAGYTLNQMIWYLICAEIIAMSMNGRHLVAGINNDIRSGKIAYMLTKPYNYYLYSVVNNMGEVIFKLSFIVLLTMPASMFLLGVEYLSFAMILPMTLSLVLAGLVASTFYGVIGLSAFWTEDANPFYWMISKFFLLFGVFFPPEFFPSSIKYIIEYSPIYSMFSGTAKLMSQFSWELFLKVTISQVFYTALFIGLGLLVYKKGVRRVNLNGG